MKFVGRRCRECGEGTIRLVAKRGRVATFKTMELPVPADLAIATCDNCGTEWFNDTLAEAFDEAMETAYRAAVQKIAREAIAIIEERGETPQSEIERTLGLSAGYLSKIKRGEKSPNPDLAVHLASIARSPKARLREAKDIWQKKAV